MLVILTIMCILLVLLFIICAIRAIDLHLNWFKIDSEIDIILSTISIGILVIEFILAITIIWNVS